MNKEQLSSVAQAKYASPLGRPNLTAVVNLDTLQLLGNGLKTSSEFELITDN